MPHLSGPRPPRMPWEAPAPEDFPHDFETPAAVESEDRRRVKLLRKSGRPKLIAFAARLAADDFHETGRPTTASSRFMRLGRIRIINTGAPPLERREMPEGLFFVTIVPPRWFVAERALASLKPKRLLQQLRATLHRAGLYDANGVVIGHLEAAYVRQRSTGRLGFQFHVHLVCDGNARQVIERMRKFRSLKPDGNVAFPLHVEPIREHDLRSVLGYCFMAFWRCRAIDAHPEGLDDVRRPAGRRLPDKAACREWFWRDRVTLADTSLVIGTLELRRAFRHSWR